MTAPVAAAKLHPPGGVGPTVSRERTANRIRLARVAKLVLIRAPAGFGKTTAMQHSFESLRAEGIATAWLTLDRADNDVPRFLHCLASAVAMLQLEEPGMDAPMDVVDMLTREGSPFALFLDDFEVLHAPAVIGLVREIIEHLPRGGQLTIGSRSLPDLGLGRLRARGQLAEIDATDLRFSLEEAVEYMRLRGFPDLSTHAIASLHGKTEGWIAALWLASMALGRQGDANEFIARFSGSDRSVAEYLAEDVLASQPADVREFLLQTSILRHLNAPLCQALLPRMDCARILEWLESTSIFLTPIDSEVRTYRYHSLFAEFLRAQLSREHPGELLRLHLAASGWYESEGRPVPAIDHAMEGGDYPYALTILDGCAQGFLEQGRMRLLARWFTALPAGALELHPRLQVISIWAMGFTQGPWEAIARLESQSSASSEDPFIQAHVNAVRPLLLGMMDRYEDAYKAGQQSLERLPSALPFADSVLSNAMAHIVSVLGQQREAQALLDVARSLQKGSAFNQMYAESTAGMLDLEQGRLRQATARFRVALSSTPHTDSYTHINGNAWAGVAYAGVVYESGDFVLTERLLTVYLPLARDVGLPDHMISSHLMSARISVHLGDIDTAARVLTELEYLGHHRKLPRVVASARLENARILLMNGNAAASRDELARAGDAALWTRVDSQHLPAHDVDDRTVGLLRWEVHFGDTKTAITELEIAIEKAMASARLHRALKLRTLLGVALWRGNRAGDSMDVLSKVMFEASREGFFRLILDEGPIVAGPLYGLDGALRARGTDDPILAEHLQRLLKVLGPQSMHLAAEGQEPLAGPAEPLTHKEMRVLKLLAEGYSNASMAEKLFVSDSTVRTHLRNINTKLGASNRTQAVSISRRMRLIR